MIPEHYPAWGSAIYDIGWLAPDGCLRPCEVAEHYLVAVELAKELGWTRSGLKPNGDAADPPDDWLTRQGWIKLHGAQRQTRFGTPRWMFWTGGSALGLLHIVPTLAQRRVLEQLNYNLEDGLRHWLDLEDGT